MDYLARHISEDGVLQMILDGVLRMLVYGSTFRNIKERWLIFKEEPQNVRLSLAVDYVNPFSEIRSIYSVWSIFVINNNLPPWMSIKRVNVYINPLVDKLLKLWDNITMHDISRPIGKMQFKFHGILTWTIHDDLG